MFKTLISEKFNQYKKEATEIVTMNLEDFVSKWFYCLIDLKSSNFLLCITRNNAVAKTGINKKYKTTWKRKQKKNEYHKKRMSFTDEQQIGFRKSSTFKIYLHQNSSNVREKC